MFPTDDVVRVAGDSEFFERFVGRYLAFTSFVDARVNAKNLRGKRE